VSTSTQASVRGGYLSCPRCGLSIEVRPHRTAIRHCPRCVGRRRLIVELVGSTITADLLYEESSLPRVASPRQRLPQDAPVQESCTQLGLADIPRRHPGMEVAYSLSSGCNGHLSGAVSASAPPGRVVESLLASPQPSAGIASPAPTHGRQRATTNGRRVHPAEKEPCHASQSL
jgi:hypothetical protein